MTDKIISQEYLQSIFDYKDGELFWKIKTSKSTNVGQLAGSIRKNGYKQIRLHKKIYFNHRLIFLFHHGHLPKYIDHVDSNRSNNKIENLREADSFQNSWNSKRNKKFNHKLRNIYWIPKLKKWVVKIRANNKEMTFGYYYDINVAKFIAETMRYKYHGKFARHD